MRAFVFPGQGAQTIGMGQDLAASYPAAKAVFEEVDDALGQNLSGMIWNGDIDTINPHGQCTARLNGNFFGRFARFGGGRAGA